MNGNLSKMASGHSSYNIAHADENDIFMFADILETIFHYKMNPSPVTGLDGIYWDAHNNGIRLTLGWDIWSGIFIMSYCSNGDEAVAEIGRYIEQMADNQ